MKRLLIFVLVLLLIIALNLFKNINLAYLTISQNATYVLNCYDQNQHLNNVERVFNGNITIIKTNKENAKQVFKNSNKIISESWEIETSTPQNVVDELIKNLKIEVISYEKLDGILVINGYTKMIKNYVVNNGEKQNIQIAQRENFVVLATPLILHSY